LSDNERYRQFAKCMTIVNVHSQCRTANPTLLMDWRYQNYLRNPADRSRAAPEVPVRTVVTLIFGNFVILGSPVFPLTSVAIASPDTTKSHLCAERQLPGNQLIAEQIRQGRIVHTGKAMAPCLERGGAR
jgi:hypothetical protein